LKKIYIAFLVLILLALIIFQFSPSLFKKDKDNAVITIGINTWAGYDPFILADELDMFNQHKVQVEIKRFTSAIDQIQALKDGKIQLAGITMDEAFSLIDSGFKTKIILIVDYSNGGDMLISQANIKNIQQLIGKKVGYEGSVVGEFLLDRALKENNIKRNRIKLVNVAVSDWALHFKEKTVDALVCFNPIASTLLNQYNANILFSSSEIPYEIIDVVIVSESFYAKHKPSITAILKAWFDSIEFQSKNIADAATIITKAKNISVKNYELGLQGLFTPDLKQNKSIFDPKSKNNIYKYSQVIVDFMLSNRLLSRRINTTEAFQSELLYTINTLPSEQLIKP